MQDEVGIKEFTDNSSASAASAGVKRRIGDEGGGPMSPPRSKLEETGIPMSPPKSSTFTIYRRVPPPSL